MTRPSLRDESGFTLIELLVAMLGAVVVIFALLGILTGTLRLTQRTFTRVDATRQGRSAISDIENELHSGCAGVDTAPVQAGSTSTTLNFLSYYGAAVTPTPIWHVLSYTAGTLTDTTYMTTSSAGVWTQGTYLATNTLMTNVAQRLSSGSPVPVFQYFTYQSGSTDGGGTYWYIPDGTTPDPVTGKTPSANPLPDSGTGGLSPAYANETVEVIINLSVGATSESLNSPTLTAVNDQIDDAVSLRLTPPPNQVATTVTVASGAIPAGYGPCQ